MSFFLLIYRKCWVDAIEGVKRKLEDGETVEADEANDPSNPFSKRGEKKSRKGKSKVVSTLTPVFHNISSKNCLYVLQGRRKGDEEGANAPSIFGKLHTFGGNQVTCNNCSGLKIFCIVNFKPLRHFCT